MAERVSVIHVRAARGRDPCAPRGDRSSRVATLRPPPNRPRQHRISDSTARSVEVPGRWRPTLCSQMVSVLKWPRFSGRSGVSREPGALRHDHSPLTAQRSCYATSRTRRLRAPDRRWRAFSASGPLHPTGSDQGNKTDQLHSILVESAWYPAQLVALVSFACVAAGLLALKRDPVVRDHLGRMLLISVTIAAFMGVETIVNPAWGLTIAALAVAGGLTRAFGNRIVLALGLLGGIAFAVATATIAFTDTFDPLFPVAGLAGAWLVATGVVGLTRRPPQVTEQAD